MGVTVYCQQCGRGATINQIGELPECHVCGPTIWRSATEPRVDYELNVNDRKFLKSIRVEPEE